jgi:hypothetical protein
MTTPEVCALARYSSSTLWKRFDAGLMPAPIDRGGKGYLFDRKAVRTTLGLDRHDQPPEEAHDASITAEAYAEAHAREVRRRKGARWRERQVRKLAKP